MYSLLTTKVVVYDAIAEKAMTYSAKEYSSLAQGRITSVSGTPYTTTNQTAVTTIYYTPTQGNLIGLYSNSDWGLYQFPELSMTLAGLPANTVFDLFCNANSGSPALSYLAWANSSARATSLSLQDGTKVLSTDPTQRYLGTFMTTATTGQTEHSRANRFIWNVNGRKFATLFGSIPTTSWTITGAQALRASNSNTTAGQGRVNFVVGAVEEEVTLDLSQYLGNALLSTYTGGIGLNSNTVNSAAYQGQISLVAINMTSISKFTGYPVLGLNYLQSLESTTGSGTDTFSGAGLHSIIGRGAF